MYKYDLRLMLFGWSSHGGWGGWDM